MKGKDAWQELLPLPDELAVQGSDERTARLRKQPRVIREAYYRCLAIKVSLQERPDFSYPVSALLPLVVRGVLFAHSIRDEIYQGIPGGWRRPGTKAHYLEYARRFEYRELCSHPSALATLNNKLRMTAVARAAGLPVTEQFGAGIGNKWWRSESGHFIASSSLEEFVAQLPAQEFVLKPIASRWGLGVEVAERETVIEKIRRRDPSEGLILELRERSGLRQLPADTPVCTLRVMTYRSQHPMPLAPVMVLGSVLRIGRSGMLVDNMSAGGAVFGITAETGRVGSGFENNLVPTQIRGLSALPVETVRRCLDVAIGAHDAVPGLGSAGWDIGLTERGPVLIEGNGDWGIELLQRIVGINMLDCMHSMRDCQ